MVTLKPPFTANSMQDLFKRVLSGKYPKIPKEYSRDLNTIISTMLKVKPSERPSCEQILHMPAVEEHITDNDDSNINTELLNTIKIPKNFKLLQTKLPKSQYEDEKQEELDGVDELNPIEDTFKIPNLHSNSSNNLYDPKFDISDYAQSSLPTTITNKDSEGIIREIRSRHGVGPAEANKQKKKRRNPRTTPMNLELISNKPKKYQMYKEMNLQGRK